MSRTSPSPTPPRPAVSAVLPHPELVDEHELLRVVLVVADALGEEVHVLRKHERHPRCRVGDLAVDPGPACARPDRVAQLLCLRPAHLAVDARVAELAWVQVVGVAGQEGSTAEGLSQERRRVRVADRPTGEPDLRPVSRVTDGTPVAVSYDRLHGHAIPERAQHLYGHLVEAFCLRPRPEG